MVIVSVFGFLFPISYRHFKIWPKSEFEITFDFTQKFFFSLDPNNFREKNYLSIDSHMIRPICCPLYLYIYILCLFLPFRWRRDRSPKAHILNGQYLPLPPFNSVIVSGSGQYRSGSVWIFWEVIDDNIATAGTVANSATISSNESAAVE